MKPSYMVSRSGRRERVIVTRRRPPTARGRRGAPSYLGSILRMQGLLETIHEVSADFDTIFTWDYARTRGALVKLYEKAKTSQWNATTKLDWSIDVAPEQGGQD